MRAPEWVALAGVVLGFIGAVGGAWYAVRAARVTQVQIQEQKDKLEKLEQERRADLENRKFESAAWDRVRATYESGIRQGDDRVAHIEQDLARERQRTARLDLRVTQLEQIVRELGGQVPPWPTGS